MGILCLLNVVSSDVALILWFGFTWLYTVVAKRRDVPYDEYLVPRTFHPQFWVEWMGLIGTVLILGTLFTFFSVDALNVGQKSQRLNLSFGFALILAVATVGLFFKSNTYRRYAKLKAELTETVAAAKGNQARIACIARFHEENRNRHGYLFCAPSVRTVRAHTFRGSSYGHSYPHHMPMHQSDDDDLYAGHPDIPSHAAHSTAMRSTFFTHDLFQENDGPFYFNNDFSHAFPEQDIPHYNPASGLEMMPDQPFGIDVGGNIYGTSPFDHD